METFLGILDSARSTHDQKLLLMREILVLCNEPQYLVDLFFNFDCDMEPLDIFER